MDLLIERTDSVRLQSVKTLRAAVSPLRVPQNSIVIAAGPILWPDHVLTIRLISSLVSGRRCFGGIPITCILLKGFTVNSSFSMATSKICLPTFRISLTVFSE